jgi:hypothetical protein
MLSLRDLETGVQRINPNEVAIFVAGEVIAYIAGRTVLPISATKEFSISFILTVSVFACLILFKVGAHYNRMDDMEEEMMIDLIDDDIWLDNIRADNINHIQAGYHNCIHRNLAAGG